MVEKRLLDRWSTLEITTVEWLYDKINEGEQRKIKLDILANCLFSGRIENIRLDILRNYQENVYLGSTCYTMRRIKPVIEECHEKCNQDETWYFVIIFILLYSKGNVFSEHCSNQCCVMNESLKDVLLEDFLPSYIEVNGIKIPFKLFESCQCYRRVYRNNIEQILVSKCKNYMITSNKMDTKAPVIIPSPSDLHGKMQNWKIFADSKKSDTKVKVEILLYQLHKKQFENYNIAFLDKLIFSSGMYIGLNEYLYDTISHRTTETHEIKYNSADIHVIDIHQLIPKILLQRDRREQIYRLTITPKINKNILRKLPRRRRRSFPIQTVSFLPVLLCDKNKPIITPKEKRQKQITLLEIDIVEEDDHNSDPNIIYLWNTQYHKHENKSVVIDVHNIGLSHFNYHILHPQNTVPKLRIQCNISCHLTVVVEYSTVRIDDSVFDIELSESEDMLEETEEEKEEKEEVKDERINLNWESENTQIVVLGGGGAGKTALISRFMYDNFDASAYDPTIESQFTKAVMIDGKECVLEILDTAGQDQYGTMHQTWIEEGEVFILVYDITHRYSYDEALMFREKILSAVEEMDKNEPPIVLVGCKSDLESQREVPMNVARMQVKQWDNAAFFEVSAKGRINHEECFYEAVRLLRKQKSNNVKKSSRKAKILSIFSKK